MKQYETVFLVSPTLTEEETAGIINQMADVVAKKKGKMISKEEWGKRRLAYPIKKFEEAFYVLFHYEGESEIPTELERRFKQTEAIIRFLTVREEASETRRRKEAKATPKKKQEVPEERREREAQQKSSSDKSEEEAKEE